MTRSVARGEARECNWAGSYTYRAHALHRPRSLEQVQEIVAAAPPSPRAFATACSPRAQRPRRRPAQPRLAAAHLRRGLDRDRDPRLGRHERKPRDGGSGARDRDLERRARDCVERGPRLRRTGRRARRARRGHARHTRRRARLRGPPARLRGPRVARALRALRRDRLEWRQRQRVHALGPGDRSGLGQEPRDRRARGARRELFGATAATAERHPIPGLDPASSTPQLGAPGLWSDRLPHFRIGFTPSTGEEIQSEYLVPRAKAVAAIEAVRGLARTIRSLLLVGEIRAIAADRLWMSPQYGQDTIGIHFTWKREHDAVSRALGELEAALAPFDAPALGQAVHRGGRRDRAALRAPARLPVSRRAVRPARRVSQRLARASNARQPVATVRPPCGYRVVLFLRLPAAAGSLAGAAVPFVEDLLARRSSAFGPPAPRIAFETSLTWLFPCAGDA